MEGLRGALKHGKVKRVIMTSFLWRPWLKREGRKRKGRREGKRKRRRGKRKEKRKRKKVKEGRE